MPHLVILYTPNLEGRTDLDGLCRSLADTMLAVRDEAGKQVFPTGGARVLAFPATHYAVADGSGDYGFMYLNLRMGAGRSAGVFESMPVGFTLQIDESPGQVYDGKHSSLHPLFDPAVVPAQAGTRKGGSPGSPPPRG